MFDVWLPRSTVIDSVLDRPLVDDRRLHGGLQITLFSQRVVTDDLRRFVPKEIVEGRLRPRRLQLRAQRRVQVDAGDDNPRGRVRR